MIFYLGFHFLLPLLIYGVIGYQPTYQNEIFNYHSILKSVFINVFSLFVGAVLIYFIPLPKKLLIDPQAQKDFKSRLYLITAFIVGIGSIFASKGYGQSLKTLQQSASFFSYSNMFINLENYFMFALALSSNFTPSSQFFFL